MVSFMSLQWNAMEARGGDKVCSEQKKSNILHGNPDYMPFIYPEVPAKKKCSVTCFSIRMLKV